MKFELRPLPPTKRFLKGLSCLKGAADATVHYQNGDHEMALTAQDDAGNIDALDLDMGGEGGEGS